MEVLGAVLEIKTDQTTSRHQSESCVADPSCLSPNVWADWCSTPLKAAGMTLVCELGSNVCVLSSESSFPNICSLQCTAQRAPQQVGNAAKYSSGLVHSPKSLERVIQYLFECTNRKLLQSYFISQQPSDGGTTAGWGPVFSERRHRSGLWV